MVVDGTERLQYFFSISSAVDVRLRLFIVPTSFSHEASTSDCNQQSMALSFLPLVLVGFSVSMSASLF